MKKELEGKINRLRVFRAVKAHMEETGECPSAREIARQIGVDASSVNDHMAALAHADGLPFPIYTGKTRRAHAHGHQNEGAREAVLIRRRGARGSNAAWAPVPVDLLMTGGGFGRGGDE